VVHGKILKFFNERSNKSDQMSAKKAVSKNEQTRSSGSDSVPCSRAHCPNVGGWKTCNAAAKQYVLKLDSLYHSQSGFKNHSIIAPLCKKCAKELKARICPANVRGHAAPGQAPKIDQTASSASHVPAC
jgi:hypothetical protein